MFLWCFLSFLECIIKRYKRKKKCIYQRHKNMNQRVTHAAVAENRQLSAVLAHVKKMQEKAPPKTKVRDELGEDGISTQRSKVEREFPRWLCLANDWCADNPLNDCDPGNHGSGRPVPLGDYKNVPCPENVNRPFEMRSRFDGFPRNLLTEYFFDAGCVQRTDLAIKGLSPAGHSGVTNKHGHIATRIRSNVQRHR